MGAVFRPMVTRPLPRGAEIVSRKGGQVAVWTDSRGGKHQADLVEGDPPRIRERSRKYVAKFRDGDGVTKCVSTGCTSAEGARAVLAKLVGAAERVRAGIVTRAEASIAEHADVPVADHMNAYMEWLARQRGKGDRHNVSPKHVINVTHSLRIAVAACGFKRLRDLCRNPVDRWVSNLLALPEEGVMDAAGHMVKPARPAPRTINIRLRSLTAWGNWLVRTGRLASNPFALLRKVGEADEKRRQRRALTADELQRLLTVARLRPVAEFGRPTVRTHVAGLPAKSRATWRRLCLTADTIAAAYERGRTCLNLDECERRDHLGRERRLIYHVLVTTGLRKGELAALTVADARLDEGLPVLVLPAAHAKNGQRATLALRDDVAEELRSWIADKAQATTAAPVGVAGMVKPAADVPLFSVPADLVKVLNRDLSVAGIPKRDDRGRTVDVHALRHTFASQLVASGIAPRTVQEALRHSSVELTMQLYTDPRLLDVVGAVNALPSLTAGDPRPEAARATGAEAARPVAPNVAPTTGHRGPREASRDHQDREAGCGHRSEKQRIHRESSCFPATPEISPTGIEPVTFSFGG